MTTRRTVVRNHGNMNKGGSKTIFRYDSGGSLQSTTNVRGSLNNKRGGMDNQYTINTDMAARPNASKRSNGSLKSNSGEGDAALGLAGLFLCGIAFVIYLIYGAIVWGFNLFVSMFSAIFHLLF